RLLSSPSVLTMPISSGTRVAGSGLFFLPNRIPPWAERDIKASKGRTRSVRYHFICNLPARPSACGGWERARSEGGRRSAEATGTLPDWIGCRTCAWCDKATNGSARLLAASGTTVAVYRAGARNGQVGELGNTGCC